jgi:hypothetical protein
MVIQDNIYHWLLHDDVYMTSTACDCVSVRTYIYRYINMPICRPE